MAKKKQETSNKRILWVGGGAVLLVGLVIGLSIATNLPESQSPPAAAVPSGERKAMGPATAPVTLIEYADFL